MKTVHLEYVAMVRETVGKPRESLPTTAADLAGLYADLAARYQLPWSREALRPALNDRIVAWDTSIAHDDRILFLPPSSGG
ncbi:MAG TPA: MoaD/ThiS family protein [Kiritimatiellia bacterium]|nr:MoaD/ThiS family protein [Kiritimatiellia bacterium]HMP32941.1 MoaD/ThiS family protein [Kiritimatiellia bacterium]